MDRKDLEERLTERLAPLGMRPKVVTGDNGHITVQLEEVGAAAQPEAKADPGSPLRVSCDIAIAALRDIASGRVPHASAADRIEAAKVLLGRV
jgi:hypothetical protein